jgi:protein arginine kinase
MSDLDSLIHSPCEWLRGEGEACDIVMSSRMRLARNIAGFLFTHHLAKDESEELIDLAESAVRKTTLFKDGLFFEQKDLSSLDKQFLLERHLISHEHAATKQDMAVCVSRDEVAAVMILEEDHLRIQVLQSGFNLRAAWERIDRLDTELAGHMAYSYHPTLGFLTACPTNAGTGLRASCMLHLPALVMTKQINKVLQALQKLNLAARGMYGEGTQPSGNFFQFSNQMTLGVNETEIIEALERVIRQIIQNEREARELLRTKKKDKLEDQIWRALGALKTARFISSRETTTHLSLVRLGVDLGVVQGLLPVKLNELFIRIQPSHLQKSSNRALSSTDRDYERAAYLRRELKSVELL